MVFPEHHSRKPHQPSGSTAILVRGRSLRIVQRIKTVKLHWPTIHVVLGRSRKINLKQDGKQHSYMGIILPKMWHLPHQPFSVGWVCMFGEEGVLGSMFAIESILSLTVFF